LEIFAARVKASFPPLAGTGFDPRYDGSSFPGMIESGAKADLSFPVHAWSQAGGSREAFFADLLVRRTVVSVYMKGGTPGCDRQVESLTGFAAELEQAGFGLIAVSRDGATAQARQGEKKKLPFTLVSDPGDRFARATDSLVEKSMYGRKFTGPARAAYVFEADGRVLAVVAKVDTADHAAQLRSLIAGLPARKGKASA
jgi:peroxiredoxin Q/BCP